MKGLSSKSSLHGVCWAGGSSIGVLEVVGKVLARGLAMGLSHLKRASPSPSLVRDVAEVMEEGGAEEVPWSLMSSQ